MAMHGCICMLYFHLQIRATGRACVHRSGDVDGGAELIASRSRSDAASPVAVGPGSGGEGVPGEVNAAAVTASVWLLLLGLRHCSDVRLVVVVELRRWCTGARRCRPLRLDGEVAAAAVGR